MLSNQEIFNKVRTHLLTQREPAIDYETDHCMYRTERQGIDGSHTLKCAVGCLIADKLYREEMEDRGVQELFRKFRTEMKQSGLGEESVPLLGALQLVHDARDVEYWDEELGEVAEKYGLKVEENPNVRDS